MFYKRLATELSARRLIYSIKRPIRLSEEAVSNFLHRSVFAALKPIAGVGKKPTKPVFLVKKYVQTKQFFPVWFIKITPAKLKPVVPTPGLSGLKIWEFNPLPQHWCESISAVSAVFSTLDFSEFRNPEANGPWVFAKVDLHEAERSNPKSFEYFESHPRDSSDSSLAKSISQRQSEPAQVSLFSPKIGNLYQVIGLVRRLAAYVGCAQ